MAGSDGKLDQLAKLEAKYEERKAERERRRQERALDCDPTENANAFWQVKYLFQVRIVESLIFSSYLQEFNETKAEIMCILEELETQVGQTVNTNQAPERLSHAGKLIGSLQEFTARSTLFLPAYDQRLAGDTILNLHNAASQLRQRIYPRNSFRFKTRRCAPAQLSTLISEMRKEVGSTSDIARLQGDTHQNVLDPSFCFIDREGATLVKISGEINGADFVLSRLKNCTVWLCDICGSVRADRLENCKIFLGPVRSVLIEKIETCTFQLASQQLRIHSAKVSS